MKTSTVAGSKQGRLEELQLVQEMVQRAKVPFLIPGKQLAESSPQ